MLINDKEIQFHLTIKATKSIADLCPGRDITNIDKIFNQNDFVEFVEAMSKVAIAMSMNRHNPEPLTTEDIDELDFEEFTAMVGEMRRQFKADRQTHVETTAIKKKAEGPKSSSD